jgi:hypothetical protein
MFGWPENKSVEKARERPLFVRFRPYYVGRQYLRVISAHIFLERFYETSVARFENGDE